MEKARQSCLFVAVYVLVFAYPAVSVKVVETFGCHVVEGVPYLRADYSLECYTSGWKAMALYASVYVVLYVLGLPCYLLATLWSYRKQLDTDGGGEAKLVPTGLLLGFLLEDYRLTVPCLMW
jgi:hypothetical protein